MRYGTRVVLKDRAAQALTSFDRGFEKLCRRPKWAMAALIVVYLTLVCLAVAVYIFLPVSLDQERVRAEVPLPFLLPLFNAGLTFALLAGLLAVYRLTHRRYVYLYSWSYFSLLVLYSYIVFRGLLPYRLTQSSMAIYVVLPELLSFVSSVSVFLAALDLMGGDLKQRRAMILVTGALLWAMTLFGLTFFARHSNILKLVLSFIPGGVLSLLSLWLFGWALSTRARVRGRFKESLISLGTFGLYGLLQLELPLLQGAWRGVMLQVGVSVAKPLCAGVLIYNVLREIWQEKEEHHLAAQRARELLENILDQTRHGFFRTDRDGLILDLNAAEARILGYDTPEEVRRRVNRFEVIANQVDADEVRQKLLSGGGAQGIVQPIRQSVGASVYVRTYGLPAEDHSRHEKAGFQGIDYDVTEEFRRERKRESELQLQAKLNDALYKSSIAAYFNHILVTIAQHVCAEAGALLLCGIDSQANANFLSVESVFGESPLRRGMVLAFANHPVTVRALSSNYIEKNEESILSLLAPLSRNVRLLLFPLQTLQMRLLGSVWLAVPRKQLPDELELRDLAFLVGRAATGYSLARIPEIEHLRGKVYEFLTVSGETGTSQRLAQLEEGLRQELAVESARVALFLGNPNRPQFSNEQITQEFRPRLLNTTELFPDTPQQAIDLKTWQGATESPSVFAEMLLPIFNSRKDVIGSLLLCNPRTQEGWPSAYSDIYLDLLTEVADAIGGIAQTWTSLRDQIRRLDTATHEIRSPALAIRNTADVLLKNYNAYSLEAIHRKLEYIFGDAQILVHQSNALDALADRSLARKPREILLFREIILKTIRQLKPLVVDVEFDYRGAHLIPPLMLNEEEVSQITFNLISNAFKYAKRGAPPKIFVEGERREIVIIGQQKVECFTIRFRDYGIGVPIGWEERIFEPEGRAPNGEAHEVKGMGLGLFVSRKLARGLGGDLKLSKHQDPTEFSWYLPASLANRKKVI